MACLRQTSMKYILCCLAALMLVLGVTQTVSAEDTVYMFSYFYGTTEDGLHLAYSSDALSCHAVNGDAAILAKSGSRFRDPCITYGADGVFHLSYTSEWTGTSFGYSESTDLLNWSTPTTVTLMTDSTTKNFWAPESYYDAANKQYIVYWSSTTTIDGATRQRTYYSTTTDFKTYSAAAILYDPGFSVIDTTIVKDGDTYKLFVKNESLSKIFIAAGGTSVTGSYGTSSLTYVTGNYSAEGPTVMKIGDTWYLYSDHYYSFIARNNGIGLMTSSDDMQTWTERASDIVFPSTNIYGANHCTVFTVPRSVADNLVAKAANATTELEFYGSADGSSTEFTNGACWVGLSTPGTSQTAIIQANHTANMTIASSVAIGGLWVGGTSKGNLNVTAGKLSVNGSIVIGRNSGAVGSVLAVSGDQTSLTAAGTCYVGYMVGSGGELDISGGSFAAKQLLIAAAWSGTAYQNCVGVVRQTGGTVTVTGSTGYDYIGAYGNSGTYILSGGTFNSLASTVYLGYSGTGAFIQSGGTATMKTLCLDYSSKAGTCTVSGGTLNLTSLAYYYSSRTGNAKLSVSGSGTVNITNAINFPGVLRLDGGTLAVPSISSSGTAYFNGGVIKTVKSTYSNSVNCTNGVIQSGGAIFDTNGCSLSVAGTFSGEGGMTKLGSGSLLLSGTSSFTGPVSVQEGTFALTSAGKHISTLDVVTASGAKLSITGGTHTLDSITGSGTTTVSGTAVLTVACLVQDTLILGGSGASDEGASASSVAVSSQAVPEPTTLALLLVASGAVLAARRRRCSFGRRFPSRGRRKWARSNSA